MGLATQELAIGQNTFTVSQLPAMRALKLSARISKLIGPALAAAAGETVNMESVARALFDRLDPDELEKILRELLDTTAVRGAGSDKSGPVMGLFDVLFAGDQLAEVVPLVQFALKAQFGALFTALVPAAASLRAKAADPESTSPKN